MMSPNIVFLELELQIFLYNYILIWTSEEIKLSVIGTIQPGCDQQEVTAKHKGGNSW
jgi:hypothetical protein